MKFSVAASILALPVSGSKHDAAVQQPLYGMSSSLNKKKKKMKQQRQNQHQRQHEKERMIYLLQSLRTKTTNTQNNDLRGGEKSRPWQQQQQQRSKKALQNEKENNERKSDTPQKECDPTNDNNDVDVGILSCGEGFHCERRSLGMGGICVEDEERKETLSKIEDAVPPTLGNFLQSPLGNGFGIASKEGEDRHRQLNELGTVPFCNPNHPNHTLAETYNCDCSNFDVATGEGYVPCTLLDNSCVGDLYPGCDDACLTRTIAYQFEDSVSTAYTSCFEFSSPYAQKVCFQENREQNSCSIEVNDVSCTSCEIATALVYGNVYNYINFDCTNTGSTEGSTYYGLTDLLPIFNECLRPYCDLCGSGQYVGAETFDNVVDLPVSGYSGIITEGITCYQFQYEAYYSLTISEESCPTAGQVAQIGGCCIPLPEAPSYTCEICEGGAIDNPYLLVDIGGLQIRCDALSRFSNQEDCTAASATTGVTLTCCTQPTDAPTEMPTVSPTSTPISSSTASPTTPATTESPTTFNNDRSKANTIGCTFTFGILAAAISWMMIAS